MNNVSKKNIDNENDIRLEIKSLNENGEGVGFYRNYKLSVEKTLPGEEVIVRYLPQQPRKNRIQLQAIVKKSPLRIEPPCPYFSDCGGCQLQHVAYPTQLEFKKQFIQQLLSQYPSLREIIVDDVVPMPGETHFRNKTQLPFQKRDQKVFYGLYRKGTHEIIPVEHCLVESRDANRVLEIVKEWAEQYQIPVYEETTHSGLLRHVVVRKGQFTLQIMVIIVCSQVEIPHLKELLQMLKSGITNLKSVIVNYNPARTNRILGTYNQVLWGGSYIEEKLGQVYFRIYPNTFFQANPVQMLRLVDKLTKEIKWQPTDKVLEIYCGVGTIGLLLHPHIQHLLGLDSNVESIQAAGQNAEHNHLSRAEFQVWDVNSGLPSPLPGNFQPNLIIVDPPRKGLPLKLLQDITTLQPEKIIYISCNPRTLIQNLVEFQKLGYGTREIFPFDMFPYTAQVECLTILTRHNRKTG